MKYIFYILLFIITLTFECKSQIDSEIEVLNDIFYKFPDYIQFFRISSKQLPTKEKLVDSNGQIIGYDTIKFKNEILNYNNYYSRIKSADTLKVIIGITDTLFGKYWGSDRISRLLNDTVLKDYFEPIKFFVKNSNRNDWFDLKKLKNAGVFIIRNRNEFPVGPPTKKYDFSFTGYLALSHIIFNREKSKGIIFCTYLCGGECGNVNILFLNKKENNWTIVKIKELGVF